MYIYLKPWSTEYIERTGEWLNDVLKLCVLYGLKFDIMILNLEFQEVFIQVGDCSGREKKRMLWIMDTNGQVEKREKRDE